MSKLRYTKFQNSEKEMKHSATFNRSRLFNMTKIGPLLKYSRSTYKTALHLRARGHAPIVYVLTQWLSDKRRKSICQRRSSFSCIFRRHVEVYTISVGRALELNYQ